ncbi:MAG: TetR/AcrR family transcriptional regulator [Dermatophilaceae bacterium]
MARPRERRVDDAVLPVALELYFRGGLDGLSLVEVARRAGVSRQSVYRRWATKLELVLAAVRGVDLSLPEPAGETVRERLVSILGTVDPVVVGPQVAAFVGRIALERDQHPELAQACLDRFTVPRRQQLYDEIAAGVDRGELSFGLDIDLVVETLTGALLMPALTGASMGIAPLVEPAPLVDLVLDGAAARAPRAGRHRSTGAGRPTAPPGG